MKTEIEYFQNNLFMKFTWMIGGEAGFGIMTTGVLMAKIASRLGYSVFDYVEYPSLIRGGHNAYKLTLSDEKTHCLQEKSDILICLNEETWKLHQTQLKDDAVVIFDSKNFIPQSTKLFRMLSLPMGKILKELSGQAVMKNTIALGASCALLGVNFQDIDSLLLGQFEKKGKEVVEYNRQFAKRGYDYVKDNFNGLSQPILTENKNQKQLLVTGNEAFALGAVIGDCRFYAAYPMTPSSSVLTTLADWQKKTQMVVRHSEDEIAVVSSALGASFAGARSAVGTSGGGFALMVESISFSGIAEIPLVVFLSQRPGPATGMPTWTEQGDLLFAVNAGHGEFPKIVLTPGDVEEMISLTAKAFNLADIYQLPVIILSDMYLSESHNTIKQSILNKIKNQYQINRGKTIDFVDDEKYLRYQISNDGISPRLIPGFKEHYYQSNSYEHLQDGHTTENGDERINQVKKRAAKINTYFKNDFSAPLIYDDLDKAKTVLVGWGSVKGILLEAQKQISDCAVIHFNHIYPLDKEKVIKLFNENKRYVLIENNSTGQFRKLLQTETGVELKEKVLRYDGRPLTVQCISEKINKHES